MMKRLPPLAAALLMAALSACGSGAAEPSSAQLPDGFRPATESPSPGGSPGETEKGHEGENKGEHEGEGEGESHDEAKYTAEAPPPEIFRDPDVDGGRSGAGKLRLQVKIDPGCVEQGGKLTVTLKTKPDVEVAFYTQFKEEESGKMRVYQGRSDAAGLYAQTLDIREDQLPMQYVVSAAAADDKGTDGGASGQWFHVVAKKGDCKH